MATLSVSPVTVLRTPDQAESRHNVGTPNHAIAPDDAITPDYAVTPDNTVTPNDTCPPDYVLSRKIADRDLAVLCAVGCHGREPFQLPSPGCSTQQTRPNNRRRS